MPGTRNRRFTGNRTPLVNSAGHIAFVGVSDDGAGPLEQGIFLYSSEKLTPLVLTWHPWPGGNADGVNHFPNISLNDADEVAFSGGLFSQEAGNSVGMFMASRGAIFTVALPHHLGGPLDHPSLNDLGSVAFMIPGGSIFLAEAGVARKVIGPGQATQEGSVLGYPGGARPQMNNLGEIVFLAQNTAGVGLYRFSRSSVSTIATTGQTTPWTSNQYLSGLEAHATNNAGSVAFASRLSGSNYSLLSGLFLITRSGRMQKVAIAGEDAPGTNGGKFKAFGLTNNPNILALNTRDDVVFIAQVEGGTTDSGIFLKGPASAGRRLP